jgi:hypothetical protein
MATSNVTYVCTIKESCDKTFCKYIDWADHEKNDHGTVKHAFYCNTLDGCKEAFYKEKEFKRHFEEMHPAHSLVIHDYLLGPFYKRFWCGFCNKVISTPEYSWYSEFYRACQIEAHLQGQLLENSEYQVAYHAKDWVYIKVW